MKWMVIAMLCVTTIQAQTSYKGGAGDGYASATLELEPTSNQPGSLEGFLRVYPTLLSGGELIHIEGASIESMKLVDLSGRVHSVERIDDQTCRLPDLTSGFYTLHLRKAEHYAVFRITIIGD